MGVKSQKLEKKNHLNHFDSSKCEVIDAVNISYYKKVPNFFVFMKFKVTFGRTVRNLNVQVLSHSLS